MKRFHLFEFEDRSWFPGLLRNYMTDYLQHIANAMDIYKDLVSTLEQLLKDTGNTKIIDLGSGGGGGWIQLGKHLKKVLPGLQIVFTDFFPNEAAFQATIRKDPELFSRQNSPVDVKNVPDSLKGVRTILNALHHFRPEEVRSILQNAVDTRQPIFVVEAQKRSPVNLVGMILIPILVLLFTPFIRPFRIGRIVFTYLIPLLPLFILWDGLVSVLRIYSLDELQEIINKVKNQESFHWSLFEQKSGPATMPVLTGTPAPQ